MARLSGEPLRWLTDFQNALAGDYGPEWQARAERSPFTTDGTWQAWRDIRRPSLPTLPPPGSDDGR